MQCWTRQTKQKKSWYGQSWYGHTSAVASATAALLERAAAAAKSTFRIAGAVLKPTLEQRESQAAHVIVGVAEAVLGPASTTTSAGACANAASAAVAAIAATVGSIGARAGGLTRRTGVLGRRLVDATGTAATAGNEQGLIGIVEPDKGTC